MSWNKIVGNEHLKRALEVAYAGSHSVLVVGPPDMGQRYINEWATDDQIDVRFVAGCKCGHYMDPGAACSCTPEQIRSHAASPEFISLVGGADIIAEIVRPRPDDYFRKPEPWDDVQKRAMKLRAFFPNRRIFIPRDLDEVGTRLLKAAITKMALSPIRVEKIMSVATTIMWLDADEEGIIKAEHLAEAIQYQIPETLKL